MLVVPTGRPAGRVLSVNKLKYIVRSARLIYILVSLERELRPHMIDVLNIWWSSSNIYN